MQSIADYFWQRHSSIDWHWMTGWMLHSLSDALDDFTVANIGCSWNKCRHNLHLYKDDLFERNSK
jgi:hypothetical protein